MSSHTAQKISHILIENIEIPDEVALLEAELSELNVSEVDRACIATAIENEFDIDVSDEQINRCVTVTDLIALVDSLVRTGSEDLMVPELPGELPLPLDIRHVRCLGHAPTDYRNACQTRDLCARHATISHKDEPWETAEKPVYSYCKSFDQTSFIAIKA